MLTIQLDLTTNYNVSCTSLPVSMKSEDISLDMRDQDPSQRVFKLWTDGKVLCDRAQLNETVWDDTRTEASEVSFVRAQLRGAKMRAVHFNPRVEMREGQIKLLGVDFTEADLTGAELATSVMMFANFLRAKGHGIQADRSDFQKAVLLGADFSGGNFNGSNLMASIGGVPMDLVRAHLSKLAKEAEQMTLEEAQKVVDRIVELGFRTTLVKPAILVGTSFVGSNLTGAQWMGVSLIGSDLKDSDLSHADLRNSDLTVAKLQGARLKEAKLVGANLNGANLSGAIVEYIDLTKEELLERGAILERGQRVSALR